MKTNITFKVLADHRIFRKTIPIEHNFVQYTDSFDGQSWVVTIEQQVMEMLDDMDKKEMMDKYGWEMIFDYYPAFPRRKKLSVQEEIDEFLMIVTPYINKDMIRQFSAITYESKEILFGKGKSHSVKLKEILTMMKISNKSILGVLDVLKKDMIEMGVIKTQDVESLNE